MNRDKRGWGEERGIGHEGTKAQRQGPAFAKASLVPLLRDRDRPAGRGRGADLAGGGCPASAGELQNEFTNKLSRYIRAGKHNG